MKDFPSETALKIYSLLSIGQRGAGKTVFLTGSYAALRYPTQVLENGTQSGWLDCEDKEAKDNLENLLNYIAKVGKYPPPTLKISDFNFSLKERRQGKTETLCQFYWWDIPGESCQIYNPAFLSMIWHGDGGCLFVDAGALVQNAANQAAVDEIIQPVRLLVEIAAYNGLQIPFALVLTKCDLLQSNTCNWQTLKQCLYPFLTWLDSLAINYRVFYSEIPIQQDSEAANFKTAGVGTPILWLISEIQRASQPESEDGEVGKKTVRLETDKPAKFRQIATLLAQSLKFISNKLLKRRLPLI